MPKRSTSTGRFTSAKDGRGHSAVVSSRYVSRNERVAAARARVQADRKRGTQTADWIVELAARTEE